MGGISMGQKVTISKKRTKKNGQKKGTAKKKAKK